MERTKMSNKNCLIDKNRYSMISQVSPNSSNEHN